MQATNFDARKPKNADKIEVHWLIEESTVGAVAQADIPVTDEFGCRVVCVDYVRAMIKA